MQFLLIVLGSILLLAGFMRCGFAAARYVGWLATSRALRSRGIDPSAVLRAAAVDLGRPLTFAPGEGDRAVPAMTPVYTDEDRTAAELLMTPDYLCPGVLLTMVGLATLAVTLAGVL